MDKEILAAVFGDYEAIALLITEPFYRTLSQSNLPYAPYRGASGTNPSIALEIGPEGQRPTHTRAIIITNDLSIGNNRNTPIVVIVSDGGHCPP